MNLKNRILLSGSAASLASSAVLVYSGHRELGQPLAPINAVSHWIWPRRALAQPSGSFRYTATGFAIHSMAAIFWAALFELRNRRPTPRYLIEKVAVTTAVAALTDLKLVPSRLSPGFENIISRKAVLGVYLAFGVGLYFGSKAGRGR